MRRKVLTIGLLLIVIGFFVIEYTPQVLMPIAQSFGLVSEVQNKKVIIPPTLVSVAALNYSFLSANLGSGVQVTGALQVTDGRDIAFYLMDEANFTSWRVGRPSSIILAEPLAISYNFTFVPRLQATYYFIFDNQDTSRRVVIFSLSIIETTPVLSPIAEYSGYLLVGSGILLTLAASKSGRKVEPVAVLQEQIGWRCKFCGADNPNKETFCVRCGRAQT